MVVGKGYGGTATDREGAMDELDIFEKRVLKALAEVKRGDVESLSSISQLKEDQVRKAAQGLKEKNLASISRTTRDVIILGERGEEVARGGLPERLIIKALRPIGGRMELMELRDEVSIGEDDFSAGLGKAVENGWLRLWREGETTLVEATDGSEEKSAEEELVESLLGEEEVLEEGLNSEQREALRRLMKRPGFIRTTSSTAEVVEMTEEGEKRAQGVVELERRSVTHLTSELIKTGGWREVEFKPYDLNAPSIPLYIGRRHPLKEIIEEIREIFVSMGFAEIDGPLIELAFWNFDALFQPQDHPARDMQDTFYLSHPEEAEIPEGKLIDGVRRTHEDGWVTGSTGWGGKWSLEEARKLVLRTHTTVVTVRRVHEVGEQTHKAFSVGSAFRNEKVTFKNTTEFQQIEGIIMDENANIRHLMGVLKEFYGKLGLEKVRFWPSYFPYTEPSVQTSVYMENLGKWVELCGMGIFRPEVTLPLGVDIPVLAWGGGIERIAMTRYGVEDIRELYRNDLGWLRRRPIRLP